MRKPVTIERRIRRTVLAAILFTFFATVAAVLVANENLERAMLELDFQSERAFVLEHANRNDVLVWDTEMLKAYYAPPGQTTDDRLPPIFQGFPVPFSGEVEIGDATFLVTTGLVRGGQFYLAKDISLFEHREAEFYRFLWVLGFAAVLLGIVLSRLTATRVVAPIQRLARQIQHTAPAPRMQRVRIDYRDTELQGIAQSFNLFLDDIEAYVRREQSFMGLASHELRTPIAVIAGALDVIEHRGGLDSVDKKPLMRIRRAVEEMMANIDVILKLTRRASTTERSGIVDVAALAEEVVEDLTRHTPSAATRVHIVARGRPRVERDAVLVKMLIRNLVQNAVQHTAGKVGVRITASAIEVSDTGSGLPPTTLAYLNDPRSEAGDLLSQAGFGLFIVTMLCERLSWQLNVVNSSPDGTTLRVVFERSPNAGKKPEGTANA